MPRNQTTAKRTRPATQHMDGCTEELSPRKASGVDPGIKASNLRRLRLIEGQVRGLYRMVEDDRYCADIITQVSAVQQALRSVARALMSNHLTHCAPQAIRTGTPDQQQAMYDELLDLIYKNAR